MCARPLALSPITQTISTEITRTCSFGASLQLSVAGWMVRFCISFLLRADRLEPASDLRPVGGSECVIAKPALRSEQITCVSYRCRCWRGNIAACRRQRDCRRRSSYPQCPANEFHSRGRPDYCHLANTHQRARSRGIGAECLSRIEGEIDARRVGGENQFLFEGTPKTDLRHGTPVQWHSVENNFIRERTVARAELEDEQRIDVETHAHQQCVLLQSERHRLEEWVE